LTPTSAALLGVLERADGRSHRELAGHLGLTPATLTPVVDLLERSGDIDRERDPRDRRVVRVTITPAGRERLRVASAAAATGLASSLPAPPAEHAELIRTYLLDVLAALDAG
jgi:DNA-binding MarR family transcriptional regulator